ncbi:3-hydroxyacyl-CoA dehydrogenase NAD-binding domain-containing protein [bacterium]|jgi:3-hydroxyacyl-CoA dehydrogenase|nr:3-hydroxyacyl-CoA dehydrogenase [Verrucomicrobiota bacterium]MDA7632795.1 3-hydroxyacyl-CoA dehydrogenase NAD-binding domain-containing protein [bacterium]
MSDLVTYSVQDGVAVISINNPPVNALGPGVPEGILEGIEKAKSEESVSAIVLIGSGKTFIAGADIKQLAMMSSGAIERGAGLSPLLMAIEDTEKPVVCAIHGTALGGGLEIAMACHYRIAVARSRVGQPEVKIGIIPGAEGTQRLPRLIGIVAAAELCASGRMVSAQEGEKLGVIDAIVGDDLLSEAIQFALTKVKENAPPRKTRDLHDMLQLNETAKLALEQLKQAVAKKARGMQAPLKAIEAVEITADSTFRDGCLKEADIFDTCLRSDEAQGLMHVFFSERAVSKIPDIPIDTKPMKIERAAVIGAGTMGGGITMSYVNAGIPVVLKEVEQAALDRGLEIIRRNYAASVKRGKLSKEEAEKRIALISPTLNYQDIKDADIVVEAAFENLELKKKIFAEIDSAAKEGAILASNTSTLDIDQIAGATKRPASVIGNHFFSPANIMKLLEIVRGKETSPQVIATCMALAKKLRKVGVLVGNCFGFVGNRMFNPYTNEAQFLIEEGASVSQVDQALYDFGWAMGPLAVLDLAGNDVGWRIHQEVKDSIPADKRRPLMTDILFQEKRWGQKTGQGWYRYEKGNRQGIEDETFETQIRAEANKANISQRSVTSEEIIERTIYALINEGARIIEEGFAIRSSDIDIIYIYGYGFPAFRGGPMHYADKVGLKKVYDRICQFEVEQGYWWKPAPLLKKLAESNQTFAAHDRRA